MTDPLVLRGQVVLPDQLLPDGVVVVEGGTVARVLPTDAWHGPVTREAGILVPGLVDVHCHGGGGAAVTSGDPDEVEAVAAHHRAHGTTTMLASLVTAAPEDLTHAVRGVATVAERGGSVVGSHLEGPFLGAGHRGAHLAELLREPDTALLRGWLDAGRGTVRMVTLAPELPGAQDAARLVEESGALAAFGHTDADATVFAAALAGVRRPVVTHLFNGMAPLHHRAPGPVAAALTALARGRAWVELIADGAHLADATVAMVFAQDPGGHVLLVSDAMAAAGMPDGEYQLGPLAVHVEDGLAHTTAPPHSIAGGTAHLADVVRRCVTSAGIDPVTAVAAASTTPAGLLGLTDRGRIAPGLRADLVCLDEDWRTTGVLHGGAWVEDRA